MATCITETQMDEICQKFSYIHKKETIDWWSSTDDSIVKTFTLWDEKENKQVFGITPTGKLLYDNYITISKPSPIPEHKEYTPIVSSKKSQIYNEEYDSIVESVWNFVILNKIKIKNAPVSLILNKTNDVSIDPHKFKMHIDGENLLITLRRAAAILKPEKKPKCSRLKLLEQELDSLIMCQRQQEILQMRDIKNDTRLNDLGIKMLKDKIENLTKQISERRTDGTKNLSTTNIYDSSSKDFGLSNEVIGKNINKAIKILAKNDSKSNKLFKKFQEYSSFKKC